MSYFSQSSLDKKIKDSPGKDLAYYDLIKNINLLIEKIGVSSGIEFESARFLDGNDSINLKVITRFDRAKLVLKLNQWKSGFEGVIRFYSLLKTAKIPCPNIIHADTSKQTIPYEFMLIDYIEHESVENYFEAGISIGKFLKMIHEIPVSSFGPLSDNESLESFDKYIRRVINSKYLQSKHDLFTNKQLNYLDKAIELITLSNQRRYLLHGDIAVTNALFRSNGTLQAIIDPDPIGGDPLYDIAIATRDIDSHFAKGILKAYTNGNENKVLNHKLFISYRLIHLFWITGWRKSVGKDTTKYLSQIDECTNYI